MEISEKIVLLRNSDIFKSCVEADLIAIASICKEVNIGKGVSLFRKGDTGNCLYFIHTGEVSIHDAEHLIAVLSAGEIFGELSLLDAEARSASASTKTDCILLKIDQEPFYDFLATSTEILRGIMRTLCRRLREQDRVTIEMKRNNIR